MNGGLEPVLPGPAAGPLLRLSAPLSFWGGVDPKTSRIIQVRHPECGAEIAGTLLCLPATIGSSSSAAVLLELIRIGKAPAALILGEPDAILTIGCLVAREMGWPAPPAFRLDAAAQAALAPGRYAISGAGDMVRAQIVMAGLDPATQPFSSGSPGQAR